MKDSGFGGAAQAVLLLASACLSIGWGSTWEELRSAAGPIKSVSAEFVQEKHMKILARPLISSGVFYFQAPASLRWEYRTPLRNILLMNADGTERYVRTPAGFVREDGANLQAMQVVLEHIAQWLEGRFEENPLFAAKLEPGREDLEYGIGEPNEAANQAIKSSINLRYQILGQVILEKRDEWTADQQSLVDAVTAQAAIALENARLVSESRQIAMRERTLAEINSKIWATPSVDGILQTVVRELGKRLDASNASIELSLDDKDDKS